MEERLQGQGGTPLRDAPSARKNHAFSCQQHPHLLAQSQRLIQAAASPRTHPRPRPGLTPRHTQPHTCLVQTHTSPAKQATPGERPVTQKTEPGADRPPGCTESSGLAAPQDLAGARGEGGVPPSASP